jgi:1,2-diacylglycerol 3-alpha-glucosyltransferase
MRPTFDRLESSAQPMTRVLFVSDVYFPRVNGVSTSIRTFRQDLATCGVETLLVVPSYVQSGAPPDEPGIMRVAASGIPKDPEDRRMLWGALNRLLRTIPRGQVDLVHIQTPFVAHYAAARFARNNRLPCVATYHTFFEEYLHHYDCRVALGGIWHEDLPAPNAQMCRR